MGGDLRRVGIVAVMGVVALAAGVGLGALKRTPSDPIEESTQVTSEQATWIEVHVAGWVVAPGVVTLSESAIVADAIEAAGGFVAGAITDRINLAAPVTAGEQIVVPGPGDIASEAEGQSNSPLSLNQASTAELESLPGVGPVLSERIIAFREENGPFATVEDLLEVPGIGESKLASIRDLVRP
jgi:competence protein ComEA